MKEVDKAEGEKRGGRDGNVEQWTVVLVGRRWSKMTVAAMEVEAATVIWWLMTFCLAPLFLSLLMQKSHLLQRFFGKFLLSTTLLFFFFQPRLVYRGDPTGIL